MAREFIHAMSEVTAAAAAAAASSESLVSHVFRSRELCCRFNLFADEFELETRSKFIHVARALVICLLFASAALCVPSLTAAAAAGRRFVIGEYNNC